MAMWKIWNCQTLHKSLEITNALIAVHVTSQTLYTEITNAVHVTSLPGSLTLYLHCLASVCIVATAVQLHCVLCVV